jgi:hypothetical protein
MSLRPPPVDGATAGGHDGKVELVPRVRDKI